MFINSRHLLLLVLYLFLPFVDASTKGEQRRMQKMEKDFLNESRKSFFFNEVGPFMERLKDLAKEARVAIEVGGQERGGTVSLLLGLLQNSCQEKIIKLYVPRGQKLADRKWLKKFCPRSIKFSFEEGEFLLKNPFNADLVYINSLHSYARLYHELAHFAPSTKKYIAVLHTHGHWEHEDEPDYSVLRYSPFLDFIQEKKGLKQAIEDYLLIDSSWIKFEDYANSHGFTILKRVK